MSLCAELNLLPPNQSPQIINEKLNVETGGNVIEQKYRFQLVPKPLEANHIIDMEKQLLAFSIGVFPDGSVLTMKQTSYSKRGFLVKIGYALVKVVTAVPHGGVLSKFYSQFIAQHHQDVDVSSTFLVH